MKNLLLIIILMSALASCGRSGDLYLTKQYQDQHRTPGQKTAPSKPLQPLDENQHILHDV